MKRHLVNTSARLQFAASHPKYALKAIFQELTFTDERLLATVTGFRPAAIREFQSGHPAFWTIFATVSKSSGRRPRRPSTPRRFSYSTRPRARLAAHEN
jgi:hypothetical protein